MKFSDIWYYASVSFPFFLFIVGYCGAYLFVHKQECVAPDLVGKSLQAAMALVKPYKIGVLLSAEKEDARVQSGIVLQQIPAPGSPLRAHKNMLITLSKRPQALYAPCCVGKPLSVVEELCKKDFLAPKIFYVPSAVQTKNNCIAQYPAPGVAMTSNEIILYVTQGQHGMYVFPDFTGILRSEAEVLLKARGMDVDFFNDHCESNNEKNAQRIVEQNPLPGTIINAEQFLYVQFRVR